MQQDLSSTPSRGKPGQGPEGMSPVPGQSVPQPGHIPLHPQVGAAPSSDLLYLQSEPGQNVFLFGSLCPKTKPQRTSRVRPRVFKRFLPPPGEQVISVLLCAKRAVSGEGTSNASRLPRPRRRPSRGQLLPSGPSPGGFSRAGPSDHRVRFFSSAPLSRPLLRPLRCSSTQGQPLWRVCPSPPLPGGFSGKRRTARHTRAPSAPGEGNPHGRAPQLRVSPPLHTLRARRPQSLPPWRPSPLSGPACPSHRYVGAPPRPHSSLARDLQPTGG
ncbi:hypothetical protein NDU88_003640 [Pleurodeles waltl]|uniref:Uncharacterized protein n=1 Tax=Pleurodeles waltl TaxID=8319 RepID=A0AAV7M6V0_PLEWA|nr:hypothetical protein NDU88_003640 [Pleurodeles waltl]